MRVKVDKQKRERFNAKHPELAARVARDRHYVNWIARGHGMALVDYQALVKVQKGRCAICGEKPERLCIDHCHVTGRVRGLLCRRCNFQLGGFGENPERVRLSKLPLRRARGMIAYILSRCEPAKQAGRI